MWELLVLNPVLSVVGIYNAIDVHHRSETLQSDALEGASGREVGEGQLCVRGV